MATAASSGTTKTTGSPTVVRTSTHRNLSLQNPLPLSASQEQEVRNIYYRRVRDHCAAEIREFAACATGRTVTTSFVCRHQQRAMNSCMISHATPLEEDLAREEWFQGRDERQRKRKDDLDAVEKRRAEVITTQRGWEDREKHKKEIAVQTDRGAAVIGEKEQDGGWRVGRSGRWERDHGEQERGRTWR